MSYRPNHMQIPWHEHVSDRPILTAPLAERASVVGRTGLLLLSCGTGAWRVRSAMNTVAQALGLVCAADVGLLSLSFSCFDGTASYAQTLTLTSTGVDTAKLDRLERFVDDFDPAGRSAAELHAQLDAIAQRRGQYGPMKLGLASALACCAFTFLLGGGPIEMLLAFLGAGAGNGIRAVMLRHRLTLLLCVAVSVSAACLTYAGALRLLEAACAIDVRHEAGYICAMLFIIPGFPFITSGIDMAKQDMRSGLERLTYAVMIVVVAAIAAWLMALLLRLTPVDFLPLTLGDGTRLVLRLIASFCGVYGFSLMFNSPVPMAATAAAIGAVANTLRLELVDLAGMPPAAAAFLGALTAGLLASVLKRWAGYPRISITVPSIVIMVPGLYFYRAFYTLGVMDLGTSAMWAASALLIVLALPLGLIFARIVSDPAFRHCN